FFQASYMPDEKGTILSVNHDWWGTWITYIGYFLLYLGMMLILFVPGSRFKELEKALDKVKKRKKKMLSVLLIFLSVSAFAQDSISKTQNDDHVHVGENHVHTTTAPAENPDETQVGAESMVLSKKMVDSIIMANAVSPKHAEEFGKL